MRAANSDLKLQQRLLQWFAECLPEVARRRAIIPQDKAGNGA
jgi:hypothetical protein